MKKSAIALVLILASLGLVACGGSSSSDSETTATETSEANGGAQAGGEAEGKSAGGATIDFEAAPDGSLAYTEDKVTAQAGEATIDFNNPQAMPHDVAIEDSAGKTIAKTETVTEGSDSTTVDLKPGTYTFYCTVPGHREAGMEGTLTVK